MRRPHLLLLLLYTAVEAKEFRTITIAKSRRKYEKESSQRLQYNKGGDYKCAETRKRSDVDSVYQKLIEDEVDGVFVYDHEKHKVIKQRAVKAEEALRLAEEERRK